MWQDWASTVKTHLGMSAKDITMDGGPLRVGTLFSGTDAVIEGLCGMFGCDTIEHCWSCDCAWQSREFIKANNPPPHIYKDIGDVLTLQPIPCDGCKKTAGCLAIHEQQVHVVVLGFPCQPFSQMNASRFKADDIMTCRQANHFGNARLYMETTPTPPWVVILENSSGILKRSTKATGAQAMDQVMLGEYGLLHSKRYATRFFVVSAASLGLPHRRDRVWFVCLLKGMFNIDVMFTEMEKMFASLDGLIKPFPWQHFLVMEPMPPPSKRSKLRAMVAGSHEKSDTIRKHLGLPTRGSAQGKPWSSQAPEAVLTMMQPRQWDVVDVAMLVAERAAGAEGVAQLVVDISQSVDRSPWFFNGGVPTPHTGSVLFSPHQEELFSLESMFQLQGWESHKVNIPDSLSDADVRTLIGNMMAVPVAAAVVATVLKSKVEGTTSDDDDDNDIE